MIGAPHYGQSGMDNFGDRRNRAKEDVKNPFIGSSSYGTTFSDFGALPKANIKAQKKFVAGFGSIDGTSTYKDTFMRGGEDIYKKVSDEKKRT